MTLSLNDLSGSQAEGSIDNLNICQLVGGKNKTDCYIFIKEPDALGSGWQGEIKDSHTYENGDEIKGVKLPKASMQILRRGDRYIEERIPDNTGMKRNYIIGNYDDPIVIKRQAARELYFQRKEEYKDDQNRSVRLRTLFLVQFVNPKTHDPLHSLPLILTMAGQAPIQFNEAIDNYLNFWEKAICDKANVSYKPRNERYRALCIYEFEFVPYKAMSWEGDQSKFIAAPTFDGSKISAETIEALSQLKHGEDTFALFDATEGFDATYNLPKMIGNQSQTALSGVQQTQNVLPGVPVQWDPNGGADPNGGDSVMDAQAASKIPF